MTKHPEPGVLFFGNKQKFEGACIWRKEGNVIAINVKAILVRTGRNILISAWFYRLPWNEVMLEIHLFYKYIGRYFNIMEKHRQS